MIWGMEKGIFTGKKLDHYINAISVDYVGARAIINSQDQAALIASYAVRFESILEQSNTSGFLI